jgi:16S rRNA (guanine966-N2)-methyltransferase
MRILTGKFAGTDLVSPSGRVRPTAEGVRDAWLALLAADLPGARLLELYAGSGAVGLEALSRGAASCDFVENGPSALHALKANIAVTRTRDRTRVFKRDALQFIDSIHDNRYGIVFADPPYHSRQLDRLIERWRARPFSRILTFEHATDHRLAGVGPELMLGETSLSCLRAPGA